MADTDTPDPQNNPEQRDYQREAKILTDIIADFQTLPQTTREHILNTLATFFGIAPSGATPMRAPQHGSTNTSSAQPSFAPFSEDRAISPKQFMFEKRPQTEIERVTCLAYYLTHYRSMQHFKTLDISQLNTEAAQTKFSNAAVALNNAIRAGWIGAAAKGTKQITAMGEIYVQALPDREAARQEAAKHGRPRRKDAGGQRKNKSEPVAE